MAFTSLQTLLPLAVVITVAQGIFNPFRGGLPQSPFAQSPALGHGGFNNFPSLDPFQSRDPRKSRGPLCTASGSNDQGDYFSMTFKPYLEEGAFGHVSPFAGLLSPARQVDKISVSGTFVKAGASTGTPVIGGVDGFFTAVLMEYGNTDGQCRYTGRPYISQRNRRMSPPFGPFGGLQSLVGTNPFQSRNPFFQGRSPQSQVVRLSTPINTRSASSHFQGVMNANIREIPGRCIAMCRTENCQPPSNLCATIRRDMMSVEEFTQAEHQNRLLKAVVAQGNLQGDSFGVGPAAVITDDDVFGSNNNELGGVVGGSDAFVF